MTRAIHHIHVLMINLFILMMIFSSSCSGRLLSSSSSSSFSPAGSLSSPSSSSIQSRTRSDGNLKLQHRGLARRMAGDVGNVLPGIGGGGGGGHGHHHVFRHARFTFYDAELGACGKVNKDEDHIVALNAAQFGGGYPGKHCFKTITLEYQGVKATAKIVDMCPECPYGALDLSRGLFDMFAPEVIGVIYGQWHFGYDSSDHHHHNDNNNDDQDGGILDQLAAAAATAAESNSELGSA